MGQFKSKEDYLQWADKRRSKLLYRAALKQACKAKVHSFFEEKRYLGKKFIFFSSFILLGALFFSLPSLRSGKKEPSAAVANSPSSQIPAAASAAAAAKPAASAAAGEKPSLTLEDLLPQARKIVVLIKSPQGSGSGFLLPHPGLIATCAHFLGRSDEAEVYFPSGAVKKAVVLKRLPMPVDVAFLQVEDFGLEWLPLADSDRCQEGEEVVAVGVPGSDKWRPDLVMIKGKIVRCNNPYQGVQYLQIDQDIHPAAIGGPVMNARGEILGMARGELAGGSFEGARYGLAINIVKGLIDQRLAHLEERIREKEQFYKYLYDDLWVVLSAEHQAYQKKLSDLHGKGSLSVSEATRLDKKGSQAPDGQSSMKDWVAGLTEKVIRGELTKEQASARIKAHFEL
jgi:S1-C subfamily serine protease